jgi:hypothetical protein
MTGRVQGTGDVQVAGAKVTLLQQDAKVKQETSTAEDGRLSFKGIAPGAYLLQAPRLCALSEQSRGWRQPDCRDGALESPVFARGNHCAARHNRRPTESNTDAMTINENFFNGLPLELDCLKPFIDTFILPATQGTEGTSVVVDGVDGGGLDMPSSAIRTVKINRNPYSADSSNNPALRERKSLVAAVRVNRESTSVDFSGYIRLGPYQVREMSSSLA